jgi:hypothetical protein
MLAYSLGLLVWTLVEFVISSNLTEMAHDLVYVGTAAAVSAALGAMYGSRFALWQAQQSDARLSTLIDSLPPDRRAAYQSLAKAFAVVEAAEQCDHEDEEREFISEAGMWRCCGCGRAILGARR